ncbi:MAG: right-handed parallel beta-helix repeat-containing protein [Planctomycetaceae bacterium]|nr:right-handed parallel beta-helix repeat-containing protein [Planctomycetaceae bacterium]
MIVNKGRVWIIALLIGAIWPVHFAQAQQPDSLVAPPFPNYAPPFVDWTAGAGNRSDYRGQASTFIPLHLTEASVFFAELDMTVVDDRMRGGEALEWNGGIGYRSFMDDYSIFGTYVFVDHRTTANQNRFYQTTVGLEYMMIDHEFRVNGYFPERGGERLGPPVAVLAGDRIVVQGDEELAYVGADFEVGTLLAEWLEGDVELRAFAGAYFFDRDVRGFEEIVGPRLRAELRVYDLEWFGPGSRLVVSGEFQHDDVRDGQGTGLVTVRIPFPGPADGQRPSRLQRRLLDRVVRDVDIVTQNGTRQETALDKETGMDLGPVTVVGALDDFQMKLNEAGEDSLVIVNGDDGKFDLNAELNLLEGQTLRGAGFTVVGADTGKEAVFGHRPILDMLNPAQDIIVLDDRTRVRDLTLMGGRNGVIGGSTAEFQIDGNLIVGSAESGIRLIGTNEGDVNENSITQTGFDAISVDTLASGEIILNTITESGASAVLVQELNGGTVRFNEISGSTIHGIHVVTLTDGTVGDNTVEMNGQHGVFIGTMSGGTVENNKSEQNGQQGFQITQVDFNVSAPEITNNTAWLNSGDGFQFGVIDGGNIHNNTATENLGDGFQITSHNMGTLADNTSSMNQGHGFNITSYVNGFNNRNTAEGNTQNGIFIDTFSNGFLSSNSVTNNMLDGIRVNSKSGGFFEDNNATGNRDGYSFGSVNGGFFRRNTASDNTRDGFLIGAYNGVEINDNVASENGDDGFHLENWSNGAFNDNTATLNPNFGFFINNRTGGTAFGNIATGNGDNTLP